MDPNGVNTVSGNTKQFSYIYQLFDYNEFCPFYLGGKIAIQTGIVLVHKDKIQLHNFAGPSYKTYFSRHI